jgi:hypothetical protein
MTRSEGEEKGWSERKGRGMEGKERKGRKRDEADKGSKEASCLFVVLLCCGVFCCCLSVCLFGVPGCLDLSKGYRTTQKKKTRYVLFT